MRHMNSGRKLHIDGSQRKAMFRNMVTALMLHGRIRTTEPRAKELRRIADRIITLGKRVPPSGLLALSGDDLVKAKARRVHAIRMARVWVLDRTALDKVFNEYAERFKERSGGYTRLYKLGVRHGDNAPMNLIELVEALDKPVEPLDEGAEEGTLAEAVETPAK